MAENTIQLVIDVDDRGSSKITKFSSTLTDQTRRAEGGVVGRVRAMSQSFTKNLGGAIEGVGKRLLSLKTLAAGALAGWGLQSLARGFIDTGSSMDQMRMSLDTITKGQGDEWFEKLNEWALKMPVNTEKAIQSFTMMRAMGVQPSIDDMTVLVDTVSALGGRSDALEGIARALGQIQAKGKGSALELMQLAERGVPVFEILKEKLHLTGAQIQDIGNQSVGATEIIKAVMEGLAERFGGQSEKMQTKFIGLWESLKSYWTEFKRLVMDSGVMTAIEAGLKRVTDKLDAMKKDGSLKKWAEDTASRVVESMKKISLAAAGVYDYFASAIPKLTGFVSSMYDTFMSLPAWVRAGGLIGAFLYGKTGAVALGGALMLVQAVKNQAAGLGLVASGQMKFSEFAGMNSKELKDFLGNFDQKNPTVGVGVTGEVRGGGAAANLMQQFWAAYDKTVDNIKEKAAGATKSVADEAGNSLQDIQATVADTLQKQVEGVLKVAEEDKKALEGRLQEYQKYYESLQGMIQRSAEQEKKHIQELSALHKQQADLRKSTEDMVRGLQEINMTASQKYESQKGALSGQFTAAMRLEGQERVKALEQYKQALAGFGQTWSQGVVENTENIIFGSESRVVKKGKDIISSVISDIEQAAALQQQALRGLAEEKQRQIEADRSWGESLKQAASEAQSAVQQLQGVIGELSDRIAAMQKTIAITGEDRVSGVVDDIARALAQLHDKTIRITAIYSSIGGVIAGGGSEALAGGPPAAPESPIDSYAQGSPYVPRTGLYRLHEGEIVVPLEQSRQIRQEVALRGAAGRASDSPEAGDASPAQAQTAPQEPQAIAQSQSSMIVAGPVMAAARESASAFIQRPVAESPVSQSIMVNREIIDSYAQGSPYVPRTGLYRLHEGEIVVPLEQSRQIRQEVALRGAAGINRGNDYSESPFEDSEPVAQSRGNDTQTIKNEIMRERTFTSFLSRQITMEQKPAGGRPIKIGDIHIHIPESAAPQQPEDWRMIARQYILPELEKLKRA